MYNFMANWRILEELLTFEPIATLRDGWKWKKQQKNRQETKGKRVTSEGFSQQEVPGNSREKPAIEPKEPHGLTYHKSSLI